MAIRPTLICAAGMAIATIAWLAGPAGAASDRPAHLEHSDKRFERLTVYEGAIARPVAPRLWSFAELMELAFSDEALERFFDGRLRRR